MSKIMRRKPKPIKTRRRKLKKGKLEPLEIRPDAAGISWKPGVSKYVLLINARHLRNVPGRKTDVPTTSEAAWSACQGIRPDLCVAAGPCQWIQQVHALGLWNASFRPPQPVCEVRSLLRHGEGLVQASTQPILPMQKSLDQMNLQLHHVLSEITASSGLAVLDAIRAGERAPAVLAGMRDRRVKSSAETIAKALDGDYRCEHLFTLRQSPTWYRFLEGRIREC